MCEIWVLVWFDIEVGKKGILEGIYDVGGKIGVSGIFKLREGETF